MKIKVPLIFMIALLLAACGPKAGPPPSGTVPPIMTETSTAVPTPQPGFTSTLDATSSSTLESTSTTEAHSGEVEIEIENFAFTPATITVKVGTTVKWGNKDDVSHTVTGDDGSWGSTLLKKGDNFTFTFSQAGTYTFHCTPHKSMKGTVVVVSS